MNRGVLCVYEFCIISSFGEKGRLYEFSHVGFRRSNLFFSNEIGMKIAFPINRDNDKRAILQNPLVTAVTERIPMNGQAAGIPAMQIIPIYSATGIRMVTVCSRKWNGCMRQKVEISHHPQIIIFTVGQIMKLNYQTMLGILRIIHRILQKKWERDCPMNWEFMI